MLGHRGLVLVVKRKTTYWRALPDGMATPYLAGKAQEHLTIRLGWKSFKWLGVDAKAGWVYVYHKGQRIFDCNHIFFATHFVKES